MTHKILITGNAGLLGSNLSDYITLQYPDKYTLYGIDDLSGGYTENINSKTQFYPINILDNNFDNIFADISPDYVFHLAAYAAEGLSPFIRRYNYENNLVCTAKIINNCIKHNVKRLVFTSSMAVYGNNTVPFDESMTPKPIDPYGIAKYGCEMDIQIAGEQHGLDWCIIRPHNVYGRKQNIWDKYRNVLGIWMYQHLNKKPLTIFGDGEQKRAFSYIDDSVGPLFRAAIEPTASKQIINLGGITDCTINEAADTLLDVIGDGQKVYLEGRHEVKYAFSTYQKSVDILKFDHKTSLKNGLTDMWAWAQTQPNRSQFIWNSYELEKGLYSFWNTTK
jgi:UDP-glucose 4-epimerase